MAPRDKPHILVPIAGQAKKFSPRGAGGGGRRPSDVADRAGHAQALLQALEALRPGEDRAGAYIALTGRAGERIDAEKFNKDGLTLLKSRQAGPAPDDRGELVFFAPARAVTKLEKKVAAFRDKDLDSGRPKNADLVQSIGNLQVASLRALWRGPEAAFPPDAAAVVDWEVWVAPDQAQTLVDAATAANLHVAADRLHFPEQTIIRLAASQTALAALIRGTAAMVSALAKPSVTADFFDGLSVEEQPEWTDELLERTTFADEQDDPVRVTLLDTGVTLGHPLLAPALSEADRFAADPAWGLEDVHGHGSGMAGLALYGDLTTALETQAPIRLSHRLESVKLIPDAGINPHHLLGAVTRRGVNATEAQAERDRIFVLASSTPDDHPHDGAPTSWSTELDQLAAGVSGDKPLRRLIVASAGNVPTDLHMTGAYHAVCDHADQEIEAPAQAWNALTVGAYTDKSVLANPGVGQPLATGGDLSPHSKTASWTGVWPLKPDIVLEGGNLLMTNLPPAYAHQDLCLLTTSSTPAGQLFTTFEATSAATALAGRLAAETWAQHPGRWPETIRALVVGSARWTQPMLAHLPQDPGKGHYEPLFQRYGYGVPDLTRALRSADDMVTLIVEDAITPYAHGANGPVHNHIKLHALPWPVERLRALGAREVTLRVTLSTFIEPNPAEAARGRKLQYGSHGLRFKLKRADESDAQFERRINAAAEADEAGPDLPQAIGDQDGWRFGTRRRDVGSIQRDEITCAASDLARRSMLAVHPVGGWWKSRLRKDDALRDARYALVIEIDAGGAEVDLYAEIQVALAAMIAAAAPVAV